MKTLSMVILTNNAGDFTTHTENVSIDEESEIASHVETFVRSVSHATGGKISHFSHSVFENTGIRG